MARAVLPMRPNVVEPGSLNEEGSLLYELFQNRKTTPQLIIVTGISGVGKTTWCKRLVKIAEANGYTIEGILSPGIFDESKKIGIEVLDLGTGEGKQLAKLREGGRSEISTPRWVFDPQTLKWANQRLENGSESDLLIIDELGPLEFLRNEGLIAGMKRLDRKEFKVACVVVRSSLLQKAIKRWPNAIVISGRV
jgi:nucleoside-triphosphatase